MSIIDTIIDLNKGLEKNTISFHQYRSAVSGIALNIQQLINYDGDIYHLVDSWFEIIEYCYFEEDWNKYALELGNFLIQGLNDFPNQIFLPQTSEFIRNHKVSL